MVRTPRGVLWAALAFALVLASVISMLPGPPTSQSHAALMGQTINGDWVITGNVSSSNTTITVDGNVTVMGGGSLLLHNVTLWLSEPSNLAHGLEVRAGGALVATNTGVDSATTGNHLWARADAGSTLVLHGGSFRDLGGSASGKQGLTLESSGAQIVGTTFDRYYQALVVSSASNVQVSSALFENSTASSDQTYAIDVTGASSGFSLTDSVLDIPQNVGALFIAAPDSKVVGNVLHLFPNGTNEYPVLLGYTGDGSANAGGALFANNSVSGSGVVEEVASNVNISGNWINNTGPNRPYGIRGGVPAGTRAGLWANGLVIQDNVVSNFSRYGIRLQLNASHFTIRGNLIQYPSRTPGPNWTEVWGGPQVDGIYVIRGVNNGTIDSNVLQMHDGPAIGADGITLESRANDIVVSNNRIYNVSQNAIVVQGNVPGWDSATPWERGPSLRNVIENNVFDNQVYIQQTNFEVKGVVIWLWANYTTVENNTFVGWNLVNTHNAGNGAAILTSASYGLFRDNTVIGARFGFVFTDYGTLSRTWTGEFNRSSNLVYGNRLYGITQSPVVETPTDGMGPLHNVIDVVDNHTMSAGTPRGYLESITVATEVGSSQTNGMFSESLRTTNPITGHDATFATSIPWRSLDYSVSSSGSAGSGTIPVSWSPLSGSTIRYTVPTLTAAVETVQLGGPVPPYVAQYNISISTVNGGAPFPLNSTTGPAVFPVSGTGAVTITVTLRSWTQSNSSGSGPNVTTSVWGNVVNSSGAPAARVPLLFGFLVPGGSVTSLNVTTDPSGLFALVGLNISGNLSSVTSLSGAVTVTTFSVVGWQAGSLEVSVEVTLVPSSGNGTNTTNATTGLWGSVLTSAGVPVAGASFRFEFAASNGRLTPVDITTDIQGRFALSGLNVIGNLSSVSSLTNDVTVTSYIVQGWNAGRLEVTVQVQTGSPPGGGISSPPPHTSTYTVEWGWIAGGLVVVLVLLFVAIHFSLRGNPAVPPERRKAPRTQSDYGSVRRR